MCTVFVWIIGIAVFLFLWCATIQDPSPERTKRLNDAMFRAGARMKREQEWREKRGWSRDFPV
jgi:hypothetical protein